MVDRLTLPKSPARSRRSYAPGLVSTKFYLLRLSGRVNIIDTTKLNSTHTQDGAFADQEPRDVVAGRYELTRLLARGGVGEVYAALDRSTGKTVALKRLLPATQTARDGVAHFMREYHALSELRHPRIIEVYDYGVDRNTPYYTMELLEGQDLRDLSPLPYAEACLYLRDVASSLALLHARRLLHRDVTPRNVRRTTDGHCKLFDFGAMIAFGVPPNVSGTASCVPPEALQGAPLDQRTDLYSLGALAYFVLTGRNGYGATRLEQLPEAWKIPLERPGRFVRDIPDQLDELVMSLMSLDPMKRPRSAAEVIDWLSAIGRLPTDDASAVARSFLTSSQLCGRDTECVQVTRRLQRAIRGRGWASLIEGSAGCGKTRMLSETAIIAQTLGFSVVRASARRQREVDFPFARDLVTFLQQVAPVEAEVAGAKRIEWPQQAEARALVGGKPRAAANPVEVRARLQQALTTLFCDVARVKPLLITVDDLDNADEFSSSLFTALAHQTQRLPLVVIASETAGRTDRHLKATLSFRSVAAHIRLANLNREQTAALVESMFGAVPNIERLCDWMYRVADGNPKLTVELAEHLMEREVVRYVDGTWVLPSGEITETAPHDMLEALARRIGALSAPAVALAELLSVRRGGVTTEMCLAAGAAAPHQVFLALDELVGQGVLESAGHDFVFAQETLRETLQRSLTPERAREMHRRWAEVLPAGPDDSLDVQLETGWHLVHTEDALRGADILARVGPILVDQGVAMASAIPAIEEALAVYERHGRPLAVRLRLRSALVLAGFLYDYRLATRYGQETFDVLYEVSGLALSNRLSKKIGPRLAFVVGLGVTALRRFLLPDVKRGPPVMTGLKYFVRTAMGLMGVRAVALDARGTSNLLEKLSPLAGAPSWTSGPVIYLACRALTLQQLGREGDLDTALGEALGVLRRGRKSDMSEFEYQSLLVGLLLSDGLNECHREASQALQRADMLEAVGSRLAQAAAARVRMIYYLRRADTERAEHYRRVLDLHAIQGGTTWQVEWFSVPAEGMAGATWTDLVALRRSLDRLERLVVEVPSMLPMRDAIRIAYHFRRGEVERAADLGEYYVAEHPPRTIISWGAAYAAVGISLVAAGRTERAKALCEEALAHVLEADRAYFANYAPLEVAYAMALAVLGDRASANEILRARLERMRVAGDHVSMVTLYQYQVTLARMVHDRPGLHRALQAMRDAALASGFPAAILLADRVADLRSKYRSSPLPPPDNESVAAGQKERVEDQEKTVTVTFLRGIGSPTERCRHALHMLAQCLASDEAYLFATADDELVSVATLDSRESPEELRLRIRETMRGAADNRNFSLELEGLDDLATPAARKRFRVILLPADLPGEARWVGAVAVGESHERTEELPIWLVTDICRILSEDLRNK